MQEYQRLQLLLELYRIARECSPTDEVALIRHELMRSLRVTGAGALGDPVLETSAELAATTSLQQPKHES